MILQALVKYYGERMELPNGYQKKAIRFLIVLDEKGAFIGLDDTRTGEGRERRDRFCLVPREVKRAGIKAWERANLLWDTPAYVVGISSKDAANASRKHQSFMKRLQDVIHVSAIDAGVASVVAFLNKGDFAALQQHSRWVDVLESDGNLTFRLNGEDQLVCERTAVRKALAKQSLGNDGVLKDRCLITGETDEIAQLHNAIKGVRGAQSSGANIVSFNLPAFTSFGRVQGFNAPVGKSAEFAYITALNSLLDRDSRQKIQVGNATTVFWAEREHEMEGWFADFFGEPPKGSSNQDSAGFKALIEAPKTGALPILDDKTRFYVLGLAPNASRIAIRFWYQGLVGEVAGHIRKHFDDISIVHGPKDPEYLSLFRLLVSTAMQSKADNIPPNIAGDFMKAILAGTPYPQTLLSSAIRRCRAEQNVTYPRAALIKAVLVRKNRRNEQNTKEVGMSLDTSNTNPGYLLGRLFAVLERAQEQASPGINATIRDRFSGAASSTPVAVFPHLMRLKTHHIAKIDNKGAAVNLEKLIQEIMDKVDSSNAFPPHLALDNQGRFWVGYYHQRQDFFKKKTDDNTKEA
ncbi:MAG: type I-C CRISPR-associated protein Cas8c/Csd1 [Nitrospirae bacterium]|nr:type I-C CRISPR-associated protein Cas8c/Csd1 [Nitrospirota bacterium]